MDQLVDDGVIVLGGPVGIGEHTAHLIEDDTETIVRARLADDPWAEDGHLTVGSLEPWSLWLDGRHTGTAGSSGPSLGSRCGAVRRAVGVMVGDHPVATVAALRRGVSRDGGGVNSSRYSGIAFSVAGRYRWCHRSPTLSAAAGDGSAVG